MPEPPKTTRVVTDPLTQAPSVSSDGEETAGVAPATAPQSAVFGPPVEPGEVGKLGPYRVVKELGRGGMGAVYLALDVRLNRKLALKMMLPEFAANVAAKERFLREARAAAQISHDNVVTVYEADERDGVPYIAMQFLQGYPLDEYLTKKGCPSIPQILRIARETAAGLAAAHAIGLVHRDIKPGNLWLEAPNGRVKVLDFGLAKPMDGDVELTKRGGVVGTPAFMSPEQARGDKVDHRSDLFSLGGVLYRLCTGELPFPGPTTMAVLTGLATQEPMPVRELNPEVPEPLATLIYQLLAKNPNDRPASAQEVVKRIRSVAIELTAPMALPVEAEPQPHVGFVPMQVTAQPQENSAFADLDLTETDPPPTELIAAPQPFRKKPGGNRMWIATGLAAMAAAVVLGGIIIIIKNKDGTETKIEVPDSATVTLKDKDGKTIAQVPPSPVGKPPAAGTNSDRTAAEYVLFIGGVVKVNGERREIKVAGGLPKDRFTLTEVDLGHNKTLTDAGLANFKDCKELTSLSLRGTGVTESGLANFKGCKNVAILDLFGTQMTDAGLGHFKDCKNLTQLELGNTQATDAGVVNFKGCVGLLELNLNATQVTDPGLVNFKDCKSLTLLDLGNTQVSDEGMVNFKDCKNLTNLSLYSTQLTDTGLANFKDCKDLVSLHLGGTMLTNAGLANFKNCTRLSELDLSATQVTDAGLANLKDCKELTRLMLNGLKAVGDAGLAHFKDCKNLTTIHLNDTGVTNAGLASLADRKNLAVVYLGNTAVTDDGLALLKDCKKLEELGLRDTAVAEAGLASFKDCKSLRFLDLRGTKLALKAIEEFHTALPRCQIEHDGGTIEPAAAEDADRRAAEWVLSVGGLVRVNGEERDIAAPAGLPREPYTLTVVNLRDNKMATDAGLSVFQNCKNLLRVGLTNAPMTDAGLANFKNCRGLVGIDLGGTRVTDAGLAYLKDCKDLIELGLASAAVTDTGLAHIKDCTNLTYVHLNATAVTNAGLLHLKGCSNLTALYLHDTAVTDEGLVHLVPHKNLTALTLGDTPITDAGLAHLKGLTNLTVLYLYDTVVSDTGLAHLKDCTNLTQLYLYGTQVTDAGFGTLAGFTKLTLLDVRKSKVTPDGVKKLAAARPGCKIEHDGGTIEPKE